MKQVKFLLFLVVSALLVACSNDTKTEKAGEQKDDVLFMYKETDVLEDSGESIGDLFIKKIDGESEKIANQVKYNSYQYNSNTKTVYFLDEENQLYKWKVGQDKEKISEDVYDYNSLEDDEVITYQNSDYDLYVVNGNTEKEKIASSVNSYKLVGKDIFYLDEENDLSKYNIESRQESNIANEVMHFKLLEGKDEIAYINEDSMLFYKKSDDQSIKISSEEVSSDVIEKIGTKIFYTVLDNDYEYSTLYAKEISGNTDKIQLANEVVDIYLLKDKIYYLNNDQMLFEKSIGSAESTKLATDVVEFKYVDDNIYYLNKENEIYTKSTSGENKKLGSDVSKYKLTSDGELIYLNESNELFEDEQKIAIDVKDYHYFNNTLVYSTDDKKLYSKTLGTESKVIENELSKYSSVMYHNKEVFSNELSFDEIAGYWKNSDEYVEFISINNNGVLKRYVDYYENIDETELQLNLDTAGFNYLLAEIDGEYIYFTLDEENNQPVLKIESDEESYTYFRKTKENLETYVKDRKNEIAKAEQERKEAEAKEEISTLIGGYLEEYASQVRNGLDTYYLEDYIHPSSSFFNTQVQNIEELYYNTNLYINDYSVDKFTKVNETTYKVTVSMNMQVENPTDYTYSDELYTNVYEVKKIDGSWFITNKL